MCPTPQVEELESLGQELFLELNDLIQRRDLQTSTSRTAGQLKALVGWLLMLSCAVRVALALVNVVQRRDLMASRAEGTDVTTLGLQLGERWLHLHLAAWAQVLSFLFIGILMLSSTRAFLLTVWRSRTSAAMGWGLPVAVTPHVMAPLVTQLLGLYMLSSLLLLRINVPCHYRAVLTEVWPVLKPPHHATRCLYLHFIF